MKRMFTLLLFAALGLNAFAAKNDGLRMYLCNSEADALLCSGTCQSETSATLNFNVDVQASVVTKKLIQDGKLLETASFSDCAVADPRNWLCRSSSGESIYRMASGTYFSKSVLGNSTLYWCAR